MWDKTVLKKGSLSKRHQTPSESPLTQIKSQYSQGDVSAPVSVDLRLNNLDNELQKLSSVKNTELMPHASICTPYLNDCLLLVILVTKLFCYNFYNDLLEDLKGEKNTNNQTPNL